MTTPEIRDPAKVEKAGSGGKPLRAFSRELRLLNSSDFTRVFSGGVKSSDRFFTVLARQSPANVTRSRLGLAIAKKQLRRAVDRNRVKRLVREYFRTEVVAGSGCPLDYVVLARHAVLRKDNRDLRHSLSQLFERVREKTGGGNDTERSVP